MPDRQSFVETIRTGYACAGDAAALGAGVYGGTPEPGLEVRVPFRTLNRHGLIAGATGTGKTRTLQVLTEALSGKGVPVLLMDMKGDLSGIARPGEAAPRVLERHAAMGLPWKASGYPVEFLTMSEGPGARMRATVSEFGPLLLARILGAGDVQAGVLAMTFKYCDDHGLLLLDLKDLKEALLHLTRGGQEEIERTYGRVSAASTGAIIRSLAALEQEGAEAFFGEPSFDVQDLLRTDAAGRGIVHVIRLADMLSRPRLFSTFMISLLAEMHARFPEEGDLEAPKLAVFVDEAHLLFKDASAALLDQMETTIRLIRSKGVGIFFCTQSPADLPREILAQLGLKVQHALRAFTAADRKSIRVAAENYPQTEYYRTDEQLTTLATGEAFVTALDERGIPTPLVHTLLRAPSSRMGILTEEEIREVCRDSLLAPRYAQSADRESAYELLRGRAERSLPARPDGRSGEPGGGSSVEKILRSPLSRRIGATVARELTRGLLGALGLGGGRRSSRRGLF
ncbi:MAG: helicase HerA-like domain-containing protein [Bacteroidota bacterium]